MSTVDTTALDELVSLGAATLHEAMGRRGAVCEAIRPLRGLTSCTLAGRALTVDCAPGDNLALHRALSVARPGDVIIADAKGHRAAGVWGELMTVQAIQAGVAGVVVDGAVRDVRAIVDLGFPVYSRAVSIGGPTKHDPGRLDEVVVVGGVTVHPGDLVVGDADGVVVIPAETVGPTLAAARERDAKERFIKDEIRRGRKLIDLLDLSH
jgi:4-hydroxy-4-methyl-2-oxoglutarate aldolase